MPPDGVNVVERRVKVPGKREAIKDRFEKEKQKELEKQKK